MGAKHTPGPWQAIGTFIGTVEEDYQTIAYASDHRNRKPWADGEQEANAHLIAAAPTMADALNYVADNTYCGADAEWHFKPGYDPQVVLDAIARALGQGGEE